MGLKEDVSNLVCHLVASPESVELVETHGATATIYELHLAAADIGRVIGKNGRTIGALRAILAAIGFRSGHRIVLEIVEGRHTGSLR